MRSVELQHTVHSSIRIDTLTEKQQLPFFVGMTAAVVSLDEKKRKRFIHCTLHIVHYFTVRVMDLTATAPAASLAET